MRAKPRARLEDLGGVLVDRTQPERTVFYHPAASDTTDTLIGLLDAGDYRGVASLLRAADIERVRPRIIAAARRAPMLPPNLAQGLAMLGGAQEVNLLQAHLKDSLRRRKGMSEAEQLALVHCADELLRLRPSPRAARALVEAVRSGSPWIASAAASCVSTNLLRDPPIKVERILRRALPLLLIADDDCFVSAFPILLRTSFHQARKRCLRLVAEGADHIRTVLARKLTGCPYYALPLLLRAFRVEPQLDIRISIAEAIGPALSRSALERLVREALKHESPAIRLSGALLLRYFKRDDARRLAGRRDPEPRVEEELRAFRRGDEEAQRVPRAASRKGSRKARRV